MNLINNSILFLVHTSVAMMLSFSTNFFVSGTSSLTFKHCLSGFGLLDILELHISSLFELLSTLAVLPSFRLGHCKVK
jgi:hypothetical protein